MKTLFLFEDYYHSFFFELSGDFRHFNKVFAIGDRGKDQRSDDLNDLVFDEKGKCRVQMLTEPTRDWTYFVHCGVLRE